MSKQKILQTRNPRVNRMTEFEEKLLLSLDLLNKHLDSIDTRLYDINRKFKGD